jgi:hypothetical protein
VHAGIDLADGPTAIEARALRELAEYAGARKVVIHYDWVRSDDDVESVATKP